MSTGAEPTSASSALPDNSGSAFAKRNPDKAVQQSKPRLKKGKAQEASQQLRVEKVTLNRTKLSEGIKLLQAQLAEGITRLSTQSGHKESYIRGLVYHSDHHSLTTRSITLDNAKLHYMSNKMNSGMCLLVTM